MSVQQYPAAHDLEDKLSSLADPILAERLQSANPDLFTSAAAREEISIFAAAWKRFGNIALAVTAAASIVAGYVLTPMVVHRHSAPAALAKPVVVQKARPPSHPNAALRARVRRDEAEIARLRARLAVKHAAPAPVYVAPVHHAAVQPARPVHHAAVAHHPAAVSHAFSAAAYPAPAPEQKQDVGSSASTDTATNTNTNTNTDTGVGTPDGTKNPPPSTGRGGGGWDHIPAGIGGIILGRTIDPCTPQGGRIGTVLQAVAGQLLTHGGRF